MNPEIVDVIDENDQVLYQAERKKTFEHNLLCRITHAFLIDRATRKIVLLVRSKNASFRPLHYAVVGGYVQTGESWEQGIAREVLEEVGIETEFTFLGKNLSTDQSNGKTFMDGVFAGLIDAETIKIDLNDLDRVVLVSIEELQDMLENEPKLHPLLKQQVDVFLPFYATLVSSL